jgi:arabinose-5-phosphate isomerase
MTCAEAMRSGERVAAVAPATPVVEVMRAISKARTGSAVLCDEAGVVVGIFTDGDLRRRLAVTDAPAALLSAPVSSLATMPCRSVRGMALVQEAMNLCAALHIEDLPVVDDAGRLLGLIDLQDLAQRGFSA